MTNPLDFTGQVALVTGAAAGIGLATARGSRRRARRRWVPSPSSGGSMPRSTTQG